MNKLLELAKKMGVEPPSRQYIEAFKALPDPVKGDPMKPVEDMLKEYKDREKL